MCSGGCCIVVVRVAAPEQVCWLAVVVYGVLLLVQYACLLCPRVVVISKGGHVLSNGSGSFNLPKFGPVIWQSLGCQLYHTVNLASFQARTCTCTWLLGVPIIDNLRGLCCRNLRGLCCALH